MSGLPSCGLLPSPLGYQYCRISRAGALDLQNTLIPPPPPPPLNPQLLLCLLPASQALPPYLQLY